MNSLNSLTVCFYFFNYFFCCIFSAIIHDYYFIISIALYTVYNARNTSFYIFFTIINWDYKTNHAISPHAIFKAKYSILYLSPYPLAHKNVQSDCFISPLIVGIYIFFIVFSLWQSRPHKDKQCLTFLFFTS